MDPRSGSVLVQAVPQEVLGDRTVSTTRHAIVSGVSAAGIVVAGSYQTPVSPQSSNFLSQQVHGYQRILSPPIVPCFTSAIYCLPAAS